MAPEQCKQSRSIARRCLRARIVAWELFAQERLFKRDATSTPCKRSLPRPQEHAQDQARCPAGRRGHPARAPGQQEDRYASADEMRRAPPRCGGQASLRADGTPVASFVKPSRRGAQRGAPRNCSRSRTKKAATRTRSRRTDDARRGERQCWRQARRCRARGIIARRAARAPA